jgi:hypothetical protein
MTEKEIQDILDNARGGLALVTFEAACFEPKRVDAEVSRDTAAKHGTTPDSIEVVKRTVMDAKVQWIKTILGRARNYHYKMTRPWAGRRVGIIRGQDLLPYARQMNEFKKEFNAAVEDATREWPLIVARQAERLNGMFRVEDYPTQEGFRRRFRLDYYTEQIPANGDWLLNVPRSAVEEIAGTFESQMSDRLKAMRSSVYEDAIKVLRNAREVLSKGSPNGIRNALVANIREQAEWLRDLNIEGDAEIMSIVRDLEQQIVNAGADEIRENRQQLDAAEAATARAIAVLGRKQ